MRLSIIDPEGATVATFDDVRTARAFARESLRDDPAAGDELAVVEYDDQGKRGGDAVFIGDFLRRLGRTNAALLRLIAEQEPMTAVQMTQSMGLQTESVAAVATTVRAHQRALDESDLVAAILRNRRSLTSVAA